jgi:hypothetical protein
MYAAKIESGLVTQVIRGDASWAAERLGGSWEPSEHKVGIGWSFSAEDGFRTFKPYPSWQWSDGSWKAPVEYPDDGNSYTWDEETLSWTEDASD